MNILTWTMNTLTGLNTKHEYGCSFGFPAQFCTQDCIQLSYVH